MATAGHCPKRVFKCQVNTNSDHIIIGDVLNYVLYYFISDNTSQYGVTTDAHMKTAIK